LRRSRLIAAVAVATATLVGVPSVADAAPRPKPVKNDTVQLLAMNDFHGRFTPQANPGDGGYVTDPGADKRYGTSDDTTVAVGGAPYIAGTLDRLEASYNKSVSGPKASYFVGAGDLVSATPFESAVYKDEPTIEVLNEMGLDVSSVGNHEFDRGTTELRRISAATDWYERLQGQRVTACQDVTIGVDGCFGEGGHEFEGAEFPYLAANVISKKTGLPILPPYQIFKTPSGKKLGLIGVVTDTTPTIVSPNGITDVTFIDEAKAVNTWVKVLQLQGVQALGVLVHEGGAVTDPVDLDLINNCTGLTGDIVGINQGVSAAVDLIVSAHSHTQYNCTLNDPKGNPRMVTQAGYYGRLITDIRLSIDRRTGDVDRANSTATNVPVTREKADQQVQKIIDYWNARAAETGNIPVGEISNDFIAPNGSSQRDREWALVNLIADSQLWAMQQDPNAGSPVIAFMNPGGARASLQYDEAAADGVITYREVFDVQPFSNTVNAITMTGAQIDDLLEEQPAHSAGAGTQGRTNRLILGVSDGFTFDWDPNAPEGSRVPDDSIKLDGETIDPGASYRVVANGFLVPGGDSFDTFKLATDNYVGMLDVEASLAYFEEFSPIGLNSPAPLLGRSVCIGATGCPPVNQP
jgi:5'-nucleotidase